jgi:hypothetical protein
MITDYDSFNYIAIAALLFGLATAYFTIELLSIIFGGKAVQNAYFNSFAKKGIEPDEWPDRLSNKVTWLFIAWVIAASIFALTIMYLYLIK